MLYITNDLNIIYLFRAITNYTIVFFVWSFSIIVHLKYNPIKHYIIASWIYNIYAILQIYGLNFLDWASQNRTTIGRGQTGAGGGCGWRHHRPHTSQSGRGRKRLPRA